MCFVEPRSSLAARGSTIREVSVNLASLEATIEAMNSLVTTIVSDDPPKAGPERPAGVPDVHHPLAWHLELHAPIEAASCTIAPGVLTKLNRWTFQKLGQYHCWNRVYDIQTGRWTTPDPAMSPWKNLYTYVGLDPIRFVDSNGLARDEWVTDCPADYGRCVMSSLDCVMKGINAAIQAVVTYAAAGAPAPGLNSLVDTTSLSGRIAANSVVDKLRRIRNYALSDALKIECRCCTSEHVDQAAYAQAGKWRQWWRGDFIGVCPMFFEPERCFHKAAALFHELCHAVLGVEHQDVLEGRKIEGEITGYGPQDYNEAWDDFFYPYISNCQCPACEDLQRRRGKEIQDCTHWHVIGGHENKNRKCPDSWIEE